MITEPTAVNVQPYYQDDLVTLFHGNCQSPAIMPLLMGASADAVITDPPYGETSLKWDRWPRGWPSDMAAVAPALWCFGSTRMFFDHLPEFDRWKFSHEVIWEKQNGSGFATDKFRRVHEVATLWYQGPWSSIQHDVPKIPSLSGQSKTVRRSGTDRSAHSGSIGGNHYVDDGMRLTTSVIRVPRDEAKSFHPTQKPLGIMSPLIHYSVPSGGLVVDPFAGSGTTLLAAKLAGRRAIGIEADERYCAAAAKRLSQQTFDLEGIA